MTKTSKTKIRELAEDECRNMMTDGKRLDLQGLSVEYLSVLSDVLKVFPTEEELREFRAWRERKTSGQAGEVWLN